MKDSMRTEFTLSTVMQYIESEEVARAVTHLCIIDKIELLVKLSGKLKDKSKKLFAHNF